jgi:hypothetical protein
MKSTIAAVALLLGTALVSGQAQAANMTAESMHRVKTHGKTVMVHEMKMDDGSVVFAMSRSDLQKLLNLRSREFSDSFPR